MCFCLRRKVKCPPGRLGNLGKAAIAPRKGMRVSGLITHPGKRTVGRWAIARWKLCLIGLIEGRFLREQALQGGLSGGGCRGRSLMELGLLGYNRFGRG